MLGTVRSLTSHSTKYGGVLAMASSTWSAQATTGGGGFTRQGLVRNAFHMKFETADLPQ